MSYFEKYLKYKNKYLALKSSLSSNNFFLKGGADEEAVPENIDDAIKQAELEKVQAEAQKAQAEAQQAQAEANKAVEPETITDTTIDTTVDEKFNKNLPQTGGAKKKAKKAKSTDKYKKHFFSESDSDITENSSITDSSDEFSSSDLDW